MVRIALVEDHLMFRQGLKLFLEQIPDFQVVLEAECGAEYERKYHPDKVDITLMDLRLKGQHGLQTTQNLVKKYPQIKIIIVSMFADSQTIINMMVNGVSGYVAKEEDGEVVEETIRGVRKNGFHFHKDIGAMYNLEVAKAIKRHKSGEPFSFNGTTFSEREIEIAVHICNQMSHKKIMKKMNISDRTIEGLKKRMVEKTFSENFMGVVIHLFRYHHLFPEDLESDVALKLNYN